MIYVKEYPAYVLFQECYGFRVFVKNIKNISVTYAVNIFLSQFASFLLILIMTFSAMQMFLKNLLQSNLSVSKLPQKFESQLEKLFLLSYTQIHFHFFLVPDPLGVYSCVRDGPNFIFSKNFTTGTSIIYYLLRFEMPVSSQTRFLYVLASISEPFILVESACSICIEASLFSLQKLYSMF